MSYHAPLQHQVLNAPEMAQSHLVYNIGLSAYAQLAVVQMS